MAIELSELLTSLWQRCDELRGGFSTRDSRLRRAQVLRAWSGSKGKPSIGDDINKKVIAPHCEC
jgi:hypothetical protein